MKVEKYLEEVRNLKGSVGGLTRLHKEVAFDLKLDHKTAQSILRYIELELYAIGKPEINGEIIELFD